MKNEKLLNALEKVDEKFITASSPENTKKPKRSKVNAWVKWGTFAACFALIVATVIYIPTLWSGKNPAPNPDPGQLTDRTEEPDIYPPVEIVPGFDMDEPCEICEFNYNEVSEVLDAARKYIPGYFTEELTSEEIAAIIPDRKASDMTFYGYAGFDGEGTLIDVVLKVNAPFLNDADVTVLFSYDEPFRCYEIQDEPVDSKLNGYDFEVYKWISDSGTIYYDAFGHINGCAIQISYVSSGLDKEQSQRDFEVIADGFSSYEEGKPDLSVIIADTIPEFYDLNLSLSEAQADADFGDFMLGETPSGYTEESIRRYKDQNNDYLSGLWSKGYDDLAWMLSHYTEDDAKRLTSVEDKENYDLSLYPIPRASSVPDELREIVDNPIFAVDELTLDAVYCRAYKVNDSGDTNGWRMKFSVRYGDVIVEVNTKGVEPEWVYQQLMDLKSRYLE